ncbi:MAG: IPTL-CTERM sorting domain-containing protein [Deltaproteobacteria bacterium]|nr:IPTL-CTERM sorting domain-containing protein [Deltaproteobacteria bacterium]
MNLISGGSHVRRLFLILFAGVLLIAFVTNAGAAVSRIYWSAGNTGGTMCPDKIPSSNGIIQACNGDGTDQATLVTGLDRPTGIDLDLIQRRIYWTDWTTDMIGRANLDGTNVQNNVFSTPGSGATGIALDAGAQKIYASSFWMNFDLARWNYDGSAAGSVVTTPCASDMALDLNGGHVYWASAYSGCTPGIWRADLSGTDSNVKLLVDMSGWQIGDLQVLARDVALDIPNNKMYWTAFPSGYDFCGENYGVIYSANLDGTGASNTPVVSGLGFPWGIALDLDDRKMYWVDILEGKIQKANLDGSNIELIKSGLPGPRDIALELGSMMPIPTLGQLGLFALLLLLAGLGVYRIRRK